MIDPAVGYGIRVCIALLFATAGLQKLRDLPHFQEVVAAYAVLPTLLARPIAGLVPGLELAAAALLLGGASRWAAWPAITLLMLYAGVLAINLLRGRRDLDCGCGAARSRRPIAAWMVWRNLLLAGVLGGSTRAGTARPLGIADILILACAVAVMALLYAAFDRLLGDIMPRSLASRRNS